MESENIATAAQEDHELPIDDTAYIHKLRSCMSRRLGFARGPSQIFDFLYLGTVQDATNINLLSTLGITHVINCVSGYCMTGTCFYGDKIRCYLEFDADDDDEYDIMQHFDAIYEVIEDARKTNGRALIHCQAGVNRSGVLAVAYAMVHMGCGPITAAMYVQERRKWLLSNEYFQLLLITFARHRNLLILDHHETELQQAAS